jgi:hypothetical protein
LRTIHTFPKEINRIWIHAVVLRPLQHAKHLDYNDMHEGKENARQTWDIRLAINYFYMSTTRCQNMYALQIIQVSASRFFMPTTNAITSIVN